MSRSSSMAPGPPYYPQSTFHKAPSISSNQDYPSYRPQSMFNRP